MNKRRTFHLRDGTTVEYIETDRVKSKIITSPCGARMESHSHKGIYWLHADFKMKPFDIPGDAE